jgi:hypothetical protein
MMTNDMIRLIEVPFLVECVVVVLIVNGAENPCSFNLCYSFIQPDMCERFSVPFRRARSFM